MQDLAARDVFFSGLAENILVDVFETASPYFFVDFSNVFVAGVDGNLQLGSNFVGLHAAFIKAEE